jgi:CubicO group peptidase (beta-lactamase class C family)
MQNQPSPLWESLGEFVQQLMKQHQVPGVALGILHQGQISTTGFGLTNVEHPLPVTAGTLFQIGSITKTFVGTAIMRLVESDHLNLDATVRTYIPDFRVADETASASATVRHLLTHTGCWAGDFFHATGPGEDALARYVADMADLPQLAPLGSQWSYNNAGFSVAGHIIERVTGQSFEAALKQLVLEPLGLARSFLVPGDVMTHRFAAGHEEGEDGPRVARPWPLERSSRPQGGLVCDVNDLLRYARFHLGQGQAEDGVRILSSVSLARMQVPQVQVWDRVSWGLAWRTEGIGSARQISHGGGTKGQVTLLALLPEQDLALAVFTNASRGGFVTDGVRRWVLQHYLGLEDAKPGPIEAKEEELAEYAGRYRGFFNDLELGMLGGKLIGQMRYKRSFPSEEVPPQPAPPPMSVGLCEKDRLLVLDGRAKDTLGDIIRKPDGAIGWLRFGGRLHIREE